MLKKILRNIELLDISEEEKKDLINEYKSNPTSIISQALVDMCEEEKYNKTFTITFGDQAENHTGMQKIGEKASSGFNLKCLKDAEKWFTDRKITTEIVYLNDFLPEEYKSKAEDAWVLVARGGLNVILEDSKGADKFFSEQDDLEKDTKAFMYGRVVNKHARYNLCFGEESQNPDYESKKGRIIKFDDVPLLKKTREKLEEILGSRGEELVAEGNYYYDLNKCGIGFHGDTERSKVVGIRVGADMKLRYIWFYQGDRISEGIDFNLSHGDVYIMSEKAVRNDWKKKSKVTLRHAAGCNKFIKI